MKKLKKLSERAIEIMVERHKNTAGPSDGWGNLHRFYSTTDASGYPGLDYVSEKDLAQALDEYQEQVKARLDANEQTANQALEKATEALRVAKLGPDPRLCGGWSDGRS